MVKNGYRRVCSSNLVIEKQEETDGAERSMSCGLVWQISRIAVFGVSDADE